MHCSHQSIHSLLNTLRHHSKWLDHDVRLDYGRTFVLSNFQYCPLVWYFCSRSDVLALEQTQKCMLRMVLEDYEPSYEELLSKCGMSMLETQNARNLTIDVYKSIHQMTPIYIQIMTLMFNIKVTPYDLRDSCRTVMSKAKTTTHCLKFLTYEENHIWNSFPMHIKEAGRLGIFKDRISKWQSKFLNRF